MPVQTPQKLEACPRCAYSLEGLTDVYRCPECGEDYDRDCTVFRRSSAVWTMIAVGDGVAAVILAVLSIWHDARILLLWTSASLGAMSVAAACASRAGYRDAILVSANGIRVIRRNSSDYLAFQDVNGVRWSLLTGSVLIDRITTQSGDITQSCGW